MPLTIQRFGTMRVPTSSAPAGISTADFGASRITPVGRVLRRTNVDELPQPFDVVRGAMSIVGPRPDLAHHVQRYAERQRTRLRMRPGVSGLAQFDGRNELDWPARVELGVRYVESWSLRFDAAIVLKTAIAVITVQGQALPTRHEQ